MHDNQHGLEIHRKLVRACRFVDGRLSGGNTTLRTYIQPDRVGIKAGRMFLSAVAWKVQIKCIMTAGRRN